MAVFPATVLVAALSLKDIRTSSFRIPVLGLGDRRGSKPASIAIGSGGHEVERVDGHVLVTGPARSGKSEWAERLAQQSGRAVVYVATSQLDSTDPEWQQRVDRHRQRRPAHWVTWEVPCALAACLGQASAEHCLLIDSLGTWVANGLAMDEAAWQQHQATSLAAIATCPGQVILVAEETGWGVVPAYPLGRQFRDRLGSVIRQVGQMVETVYLVTGGHALNLSQVGQPLDRL